MGNFFVIIQKVFPFLVFIFLEIISFSVIYRNNEFYESSFINKSNFLVGGFYNEVAEVNGYFNLKKTNEELVSENTELKKRLYNANFQVNELKDHLVPNLMTKSLDEYQTMHAKIINNSISNTRNYILIDKGSAQGVEKDMGVITDKGPIGIVVEVSKKYATVMYFLNKEAIFSARVKTSDQVGQLKWIGSDIRVALLDEIPKHIKLKKGEEIVTSGFSSYFPAEIPIGRVIQQREDKETNFANIKILLYNDFSQLKYVYLIKKRSQPEIKLMEQKTIEFQNTKDGK